jgi:hypothetical protein
MRKEKKEKTKERGKRKRARCIVPLRMGGEMGGEICG